MSKLTCAVLTLALSPAFVVAVTAPVSQTERDISRWLSCQQGDFAKALKAYNAARAYGVQNNGMVRGHKPFKLKRPLMVLGVPQSTINNVAFSADQEELSWSYQTTLPTAEVLKRLKLKNEPLREPNGSVTYSMWQEMGGPDGVMIYISSRSKQLTEVSCSYVRA